MLDERIHQPGIYGPVEAGRLPRLPRSAFSKKHQEYHDRLVGVPDRDPKWPEGNLDGIFDIMMASPETANLFDIMGRQLRRGATSRQAIDSEGGQLDGEEREDLKYSIAMPSKLAEMALLTVCRETNCQKLWHAQYWPARFLGLSEKSAAIIRTYGPVEQLERDEVNIVKYVQEMLRTWTVSDDTFYAVREQIGDTALVDLTLLVGYWLSFAIFRLTIKENKIEAAPLTNSPLMEVPPEFELPPLPPELDRGHDAEFYHYQDRGHPVLIEQRKEHIRILPGEAATIVVAADAEQRVDGYFTIEEGPAVDFHGAAISLAVLGPNGDTAFEVENVKRIRSFAFFARSAGDHTFSFEHAHERFVPVDLNVNVFSK